MEQRIVPTDPHLYFIEKIGNLPSPSPVLQRINAIVANADSSAQDVADALKLDPVMVSKVLKLANSAYIGIPRTISSLQNAAVLLGQKRIRSLVISSSLLSSFYMHMPASFSLRSFWRHSVVVGAIAESIARHMRRYDAVEPDEVFSAAIIHDIGKLVIAGYDPERLTRIVQEARQSKKAFYLVEDPLVSHTRIGSLLAQHWNFPKDLSYGILFHHAPSQADAFGRLVSIIHVADVMAHSVGFHSTANETIPETNSDALASLPLPMERLKVIADDVITREKELESLMNSFS
jgi:putative nucleotidyltransferase with HDIG domain